MIFIFPLSTFLTYEAIYHHLLLMRLCISAYSLCQIILYIRTIYQTRPTIYKQIVGKRISRTSIIIIFTQVLWSIHWPRQQLQCFIRTHTDWRFSYCYHYLYTGLTTVSSVFRDLDNEHTAGKTGQQGMLSPPGTWSHLDIFRFPCCSALNSYFT